MSQLGIRSGADEFMSPSGSNSNSKTSISIDIDTIRLHALAYARNVQNRIRVDTLRPMPVFLGVNPTAGFCLSAGAFTPPVKKVDKSTLEKFRSRIKINVTYFLTNYALVTAMTALIVALMHPGMVFFVLLMYSLWGLHSFLIQNELNLFGIHLHALLTVQQRFYILFLLSWLVVIWKCLIPTLTFVAISSLLILSHAALRDPKHIEASQDTPISDNEEELVLMDNDEVIVERPNKADV